MVIEKLKLSKDSEELQPGDLVCLDVEGNIKKVSQVVDTFTVMGVCTELDKDDVSICICGLVEVNTNDLSLEPGDLVVAEVDGTVKCKTAIEEDIDILGMVVKKLENNKILIKLK